MATSSTRRAYARCLEAFDTWCRGLGYASLPASPETMALFLRHLADEGYALGTVEQSASAISWHHKQEGEPDPQRWPIVKDTIASIRRHPGREERTPRAITLGDLRQMLTGLTRTELSDLRDACLLTVGFWGGYRRSELAEVSVADVSRDSVGRARALGGPDLFCPIAATERWLSASGIQEGRILRPVTRHGTLSRSLDRMSGAAINEVVKRVAHDSGIPGLVTSQSMRYGVIATALDLGISHASIKKTTSVSTSRRIDVHA